MPGISPNSVAMLFRDTPSRGRSIRRRSSTSYATGSPRRPSYSATGTQMISSIRGAAQRQHHQPVEPQRDAAGLGHHRQGCEEILVDRIAFAIEPLLLIHLGGEATALLGRIGQFAEAVGKLDPQA